jgi:6-phospho-beta-glucosidase
VPCRVGSDGAHVLPLAPIPEHGLGLVTGVKAVERSTIEAATTGSRTAALRALSIHPLVDSVAVAGRLLDAYQRNIPQLAYLGS